ncbi:CLUMA_CG015757, isoform A [Clunio marinus]|uniref:CLUMA_CG015757, isoform A n=1 Tax=Clunio marinus TaxID=568069 RepID=A0A1J1IUR0_9DIPT|nr:CLUMA_CG015757, isoform A [Clunio marinus]
MYQTYILFLVLGVSNAALGNITAPADDLTKEEIYNINVDTYCQTELVIKENLLDVENPVNLYTTLLADDIKDIDCVEVLKQYVVRVYKRLRKDLESKGTDEKVINCYLARIKDLGYDKMRFRFNALYGIEMEKEKKDGLRKSIDKEIGDTVEKSADICWPINSL